MSSKKAMKQAQKQAYAKHRSNVINTKFNYKKKDLPKINKKKKIKTYFIFFSVKNIPIKKIIVQANASIAFDILVSASHMPNPSAPIIIPII